MKRGAIVLCGGKSSRMGQPKALLPFDGEIMLQRVVRLVGEAVEPNRTVVVAAAGQELPPLTGEIKVVRDKHEGQGPLEGLARGLAALADSCDAVYATGCDVPLLVPAFIEHMFRLLGRNDVVVPRDRRFYHPLAAVYRTSVLAEIRQLLTANKRRPFFLFENVATLEIPVDELRVADPELASLTNLNTPEDYHQALQKNLDR